MADQLFSDLETQLDELTVVESCYPELKMTMKSGDLDRLQSVADASVLYSSLPTPRPLITFSIELEDVLLDVSYPIRYPSVEAPVIVFRSDWLKRSEQEALSTKLADELAPDVGSDTPLTIQAISFLKEVSL